MAIKLIHTSDWQIGKVFRFLGDTAMGLLKEARLGAVSRLGELAREHGVGNILVAGDTYDMPGLTLRLLNQPLERMRQFPAVHWHLLPGNHDRHRPNGLWDQLRGRGLPPNVHAHVAPKPEILGEEGFALLPAPLFHRRGLEDPTAYMDAAQVPDELVRIGLGHGSVRDFGSEEHQTPNLIAHDRAERAGLAYLALGDWHGQKMVSERCWYSGTPETDDFGTRNGGQALLIEIEGRRAPPTVTPLATGEYTWLNLSERINDRSAIDLLAAKLRALPYKLDRVLVRLRLEGTVSLEDRQYLDMEIDNGAAGGLCFLAKDDRNLLSRPTVDDLDRIDRGGFVRAAAVALMRKAEQGGEHDREIADRALRRLYEEHMKLQATLQ